MQTEIKIKMRIYVIKENQKILISEYKINIKTIIINIYNFNVIIT